MKLLRLGEIEKSVQSHSWESEAQPEVLCPNHNIPEAPSGTLNSFL
jgi:hypothetical protein